MTTDFDLLQDAPVPHRRPRITLGMLVLLAGITAIAVVFAIQLARQTAGPLTSGPAPRFDVVTFDGQRFNLEDLRGQVVVLNFWASWCAPCRDEAPVLQALSQEYQGRGVTVLGVAWADIDSDSRDFIAEFGLTYPNAPDLETRIGDSYGIRAVPETYILDRDGNIVQRLIGTTQINLPVLRDIIDPLLAS